MIVKNTKKKNSSDAIDYDDYNLVHATEAVEISRN